MAYDETGQVETGQQGGEYDWILDLAPEALSFIGNMLFGGGGGGQQELMPHDIMRIQQRRIGPQTPEEAAMALQQQQLAGQGMATAMAGGTGGITMQGLAGGQFGGMNLAQLMQGNIGDTGGIGMGGLARGDIGGAQDERLRNIAFGGIEEAGRRAMDVSMGRYQKMGMPMSSMQQGMYGSLMRDPMEQASRHYGQLQQQELGRQQGLYGMGMGLRQQELGRLGGLYQTEAQRQQSLYGMGMQNMMAMQSAPALQRLLQIRMAESATGGFERLSEEGGLKGWEETMRGPKEGGTYPYWGMQQPGATGARPFPM